MRSLPGLLQAQAIERPDEPFLFYKDQVWKFAELDWVSSAAAARFQNLGLLAKERVALLLGNGPEFVVSLFGVLKTGAVAVPLDPQLTTPELAQILKDSAAAGLILGAEHAGRAAELRGLCPELRWVEALEASDTKGAALARWNGAGEPTPVPEREGNPACLIYTSGTTGRPKGAMLSHRNYLWDAETTARALGVTAADRFLCFLPLHHVNAQVVTLLMPLCAGAGVVLMEKFQAPEFFRLLEKHRCTAFSAVPSIYSVLLSLPEAQRRDLGFLRFCLSGAAPLAPEVLSRFEERFGTRILEGYGLSEATCVSCVNPPPPGLRKIGSIGRPLPGQAVAVFNDEGMRLPPGEVGEIRVQGPNVMKGYFNDPEATAEAIQGGWLRTGDLGYHDVEGYFYIAGRIKEMIIRGGDRVYPREVENALQQHPKVLEAAVVGLPDRRWGEEVAAFVVLKDGEALSAQELADFLKERLADFKIPRRVRFVASLPKTAAGKVQKRKLLEGPEL